MNDSSISRSLVASRGLILLNLGTPDQAHPQQVKAYLKEFLMDPLVLDMNAFLRWILVNCLILPRRSVSSATAYQKVWTIRGSPLLFHLRDLAEKVQSDLGSSWRVKPAMRYGTPSVSSVWKEFRNEGINEVLVFPLYPQYSLAATESSIQKCRLQAKVDHPEARLSFVDPFYNHDLFIKSFVSTMRENLKDFSYDYLLFSFHGLPERHVKKTDKTGSHCLEKIDCCSQLSNDNRDCYRAQCFASALLMAQSLGLKAEQYSVCFQSRLGRTPWIQPFTDHFYRELPKKGVRRLAVVCPSFVADCLETLEEVQIRGQEEFVQNGGVELRLVPSLNSSLLWVNAVTQIVTQAEVSGLR